MTSIIHNVDQRTQLAGRNRMELLLFRLNSRQRFGINVFKVREVINAPRLSRLPKASSIVRGIAHIRGKTIPIIDLSLATVGRALPLDANSSVIISEYNRSVQGFLVGSVDRIINLNWQDVLPPPTGTAGISYVTGVAKVENELVQIVDVEKVLAELNPLGEEAVDTMVAPRAPSRHHILAVDDSAVARGQIRRTLEKLGVELTLANDGEQALQLLRQWADDPASPLKRLLMVISDIEMPRMDGYTLTTFIRQDERLRHLYVMLHTSLSGVFNNDLVHSVGANAFLAKFHPAELAQQVELLLDQQGVPA
jgi:two-component system chemotaxis response regulator CheV